MRRDNDKIVFINGKEIKWEDLSTLSKMHIWIFGFPFNARIYITLAIIGAIVALFTKY